MSATVPEDVEVAPVTGHPKPYVRLKVDGEVAYMSPEDARAVARALERAAEDSCAAGRAYRCASCGTPWVRFEVHGHESYRQGCTCVTTPRDPGERGGP